MTLRIVRLAGAGLAALLAAACGQGDAPPAAGVAPQAGTVTGTASKGPLQGATLEFYTVNPATGAPALLVTTAVTDASGNFSASGLPAALVFVRTSGGSYIDESDPEPNPALRRRITLAAGERFEAMLPAGASTMAITPYSMALHQKANLQAAGTNYANVYAAVRQQATAAFGFDPITTLPADPLTGAGGSQAYAMLLGAAAVAINASATSAGHLPAFADVLAFVNDFADGRLDAQSLDDAIRRFRNNNSAVYGAVAAPVVNETALSQPAPVPNSLPTGAVAVSGTPTEDQTLTADASAVADVDGLGAFSYQWRRNGTPIPGATATTYVLADADFGSTITVTASYTDGQGAPESVTSAGIGPVTGVNDAPTGLPAIVGAATEGQTLTADTSGITDADGLGAFGYQWKRNGTLVVATASAYLLVQADVGATLTVTVTYTDGQGTAESLTSAGAGPVANTNNPPAGVPTISGTPTQGQALTASTAGISDADGLGAFNYQWRRNGVTVATTPGYTLVQADVGATITVVVTYVDGGGTTETLTSAGVGPVANVNDPPTGTPAILGTATQGQQLTADTGGIGDPDGLGTFSYQWKRNGTTVVGTTSSYVLLEADVGATMTVTVGYTDGQGTGESLTSAGAGPVANVNDAPVGNVVIDGTATEDQTLTANTSAIGDADGLGAFSYQWNRNATPVGGATGTTYLLGDADVGSTITVTASYTDGRGTGESLTSSGAGPVADVNDAPVGTDGTVATNEDTSYAFTEPDFGFTDPNDAPPDNFGGLEIVTLPLNGALTNNGVPQVAPGGFVTALTVALGQFTYTPDPDLNGIPLDNFQFKVRDDGGTVGGGQNLAALANTLTLDVNPVNDAPVAAADSYATTAGLPLVVDATDDPTAPLGLLANDTDAEEGVPTAAVNPTAPVCVPDPSPASCSLDSFGGDGSFGFTPPAGFSGTMTFTYEAQDSLLGTSAAATVTVTVNPGPEALLPFLTASGELKLHDPADPSSPILLATGQAADGFSARTLLAASVSGGVASNIHPGRIVYIKDEGGGVRTVWRVNLEAGQSHAPVQVSNITNACRFNGAAEDLADPDDSIVRVDTAGTNNICGDADDFTTATAWLVPVSTPAGSPGIAIGLGQCCGIVGIGDANGAIVGVLTTEDDGVGSTFKLRRRDVGSLGTPVEVADLDIAGNGQVYANLQRGFGDQHVYVRARRTSVDATYKLLRFDVAGNTLTELFDYGIADASAFADDFDDATHDATSLYFTTSTATNLRKVDHAATGPGQTVSLASTAGGTIVKALQTPGRIVYEVEGAGGGVYSVPKATGGVTTLALDDLAPTLASLGGASGDRVYVNLVTGATPDYLARSVLDDGTGAVADISDAQFVGETLQRTCDFATSCDQTLPSLTVFLRRQAGTSQADLELVDPATGIPTGDLLPPIFNVAEGPAMFATGFGRYAQITFFSAGGDADIWLGDTGAASPAAPLSAIQEVSAIPGGDDFWLTFGSDDVEDGGGNDADGDGLTDAEEAALGTNPNAPDTDLDGLSDFDEVDNDGNPATYTPGTDTDPLDSDTDNDGILDGTDPSPLGNELPAFDSSPATPYSVAITNGSGIGPYAISDANDAAGADGYTVTFELSGDGGDALVGTLTFADGLPGGVDTALGDTILLGGSFVVVDAPLSRINASLQSINGVTGEHDGLGFLPPAVPFSGRQRLDVLVEDNGHGGLLTPASSTQTTALAVNRWELADVASEYLTRFDGAGNNDLTGFRFVGGGGGDFDGDGTPDFVVGAVQDDGVTTVGNGKVYLLFGGDASNNFKRLDGDGPIDPFALGTDIDGTNGFTVLGAMLGGELGVATALAGDLDRDGYDDLVMGAAFDETSTGVFAGRVYVLFGGQSIPNPLDLASPPAGVRMLVIDGPSHLSRFARVEYIGDVNDDGYVDLAAAAPLDDPDGRTNAGGVYVVFGGASICPSGQCALTTGALNGTNGFALKGALAGDNLGFVNDGVGDFNGDGVDDFATVAAGGDAPGRVDAGQGYVIYGHPGAWSAAIDLASLGTAGVTFNGSAAGEGVGTIAGVGDFDADGFRDVALSAQAADPAGRTDAGKLYVVYGGAGHPSTFDLAVLPNASGFTMIGSATSAFMGGRLHAAGDVNGDGLGDLVTGDGDVASRPGAYRKLILFGQPARISATLDVALLDGRDGFLVLGAAAGDELDGQGSAGDMNGDGYADFALGATQATTGPGRAYLAFGADFRRAPDGDGDGLSDAYEAVRGSNPGVTDSDGDGIDDGIEVRNLHTDPTAGDTDGDGLSDSLEIGGGDAGAYDPGTDTNPNRADTDGDGLDDGVEVAGGADPLGYDPGVDTDPTNADTDGDGLEDGADPAPLGNEVPAFDNNPVAPYSLAMTAGSGIGPYEIRDDNDPAGSDTYELTLTLSGDGGDALAGTLSFEDGVPGGVDTALGDTILLGGSFVVIDAPLSRINASLQALDGVTGEPRALKFVPPAVPFSGRQRLDVQIDDNGHGGLLTPQVATLTTNLVVNRWELADVASDYLTRFDGAVNGDMTGFRFVGGGGGDFNGDGRPDLVIGAPQDGSPLGAVGNGKAFVLFGGDAPNSFSMLNGDGPLDPFALGSDLDGSNGFVVVGEALGDQAGIATSLAGDLDRDGFDDLVIGAIFADIGGGVFAGRAYVVFGGQAIPSSLNLSSPGGVRMLVIDGPNNLAQFGRVEYVGDVNADGFDDLGVGAPSADPGGRTNAGALYVIFGGSGICPSGQCPLSVTALDGTNGFAVNGVLGGDALARIVSSVGDFNGDGIGDFGTTADGADPDAGRINAGQAYVVYGSAGAWPATLELASLGTGGVTFSGAVGGDQTGTIAGLGDFDADGFRDIAIGAQFADPAGRTNGGTLYIVYGSPSHPAVFELGSLPNASGYVLIGSGTGFSLGGRATGAGDINGDGLGDLLTGDGDSPGRPDSARKLVIFGKPTRVAATVDVTLIDGRDGFYLHGSASGERLDGQGAAGDLNADGYADFALGGTQALVTGPGLAYAAFGADFRRAPDGDGDSLSDAYEIARGSNPGVLDSDGDGIDDGVEVRNLRTDPTATDTDGDGIGDFDEVNVDGEPGDYSPGQGDTNPNDPLSPLIVDADGDGVGDQVETFVGSDVNTPNFAVHVSGGSGNDANGGTSWGDAVQTNTRALQLLDAAAPYPASALQTWYVLYDPTFSSSPLAPGPLALTGLQRRFVAFVGGLGPGLVDPGDNRTPFTTAGPGVSVVEVTNATGITLGALDLKFGNAPSGGGLRVHDGGGAADVTLVSAGVHDNSAQDGGGIHVSGAVNLAIVDVEIHDNSATSASTNGRGGGVYVGGGAALSIEESSVRGNLASNSAGPAATHGGGGLYAEGLATVTVNDTVFANNKAGNGPGGGINLVGAGSLTLQYSQLLSNESTRPGAGLHVHVDAPAVGSFTVFNNLFVGNVATDGDADGAGLEIEFNTGSAALAVNHNTVAYNQARNNAATGQGGGVSVSQATATAYDYFNNIVWFNDNGTVGNPFSPQAGDNQAVAGPLNAGGNNANESGFAGNATQSDPQFTSGFFLVQAANASVDGGANTAAFWGLDDESTDPNGASDSGAADIGYHHVDGPDAVMTGVNALTASACASSDVILFEPVFQFGDENTFGHLVVVELTGVPGVTLGSATTLDPRGTGSRIARDRGDGTYALTVSGATGDATGTFTVYADDQATPRTFTVPFTTGC